MRAAARINLAKSPPLPASATDVRHRRPLPGRHRAIPAAIAQSRPAACRHRPAARLPGASRTLLRRMAEMRQLPFPPQPGRHAGVQADTGAGQSAGAALLALAAVVIGSALLGLVGGFAWAHV